MHEIRRSRFGVSLEPLEQTICKLARHRAEIAARVVRASLAHR